jgi:phosphatidylinositol glycan class V
MLDVHLTNQHLRLLDWLTVLSRLLAAALLYLSSSCLTLFDASPSTLLAPSAFPSFASSLFRWDAFHFTAIAKDGYSYEHHWAFFPGVPMLLRAADRLPALFLHVATPLSWLALLNTAIAIPTTRAIYHLTLIHFQSPSFALLTALLSLLPASPATLYFAPYAEPIFTFLSYQGACTYLYNSPRFSPPPLCGIRRTQECSPAHAWTTAAHRCTSPPLPLSARMASCLLSMSPGPC